MFCTNCGKKILEEAVFCAECGQSIVPSKNDIVSIDQTSSYIPEEMDQGDYYPLLIKQAKQTANTEIVKGIVWILLGFAITFVTYIIADEGGTYFIFWGLVVYGAYFFLRGLYWRISPKRLIKEAQEVKVQESQKNKEK